MVFDEITKLQEDQKSLTLPFLIKKRRRVNHLISVNDYVPIPVENVASFYDRLLDLPIKKTDGTEIGYLYFTKNVEVTNIFSLSEPKYVCYLIDMPDRKHMENNLPYFFQSDYIVIYKPHLNEYLNQYSQGAPIWGLFNHNYPSLVFNPPLKKTLTEIVVGSFSKFSQNYYFEAGVRGIKHSLAFERFLKYYHLLELNFDFDVIERIKKLDTINDSKSISILLNEYKKDDIERLKYLLQTYCLDVSSLIESMKGINSYPGIAKAIFYDFGKESNPLKDISQFNNVVTKSDGFTFANCKAAKIQNAMNAESHRKFIYNLCSYWIYRVRNSIAHKKIGEYIMSHNDESFVLNFAEPLLLNILKQVFK